ncbi:sensor histidine kinase [Nautilia sp.]
MSAEKESLRRFIFVYVISTLFLVGIGEWIYYKSAVHKIYDEESNYVLNELKLAMPQSMFGFRFFNNKSDINISIYRNGVLMYGKDVKIKPRECWIENKTIYCHYELPRRWGKIEFVGFKPFDYGPIKRLKRELFIFNAVIFVFIVFIAYVLGKMFLRPVKEAILSLENFIRDATHEMNTPISIINTNIEMLEMKDVNLKEFERIRFAAERLEKIFKDLTFIKLNHKIKNKNFQNVDLKGLICERLGIFETISEKKGVKVVKRCENLTVKADRDDIVRIVDNLLSNAFKYAPSGSEVRVVLNKNRFSVLNKGKIKNVKKITDKFYRENESEGGFGLGLYIVKKICESYGYKLNIKNENGFVKISVEFK